MADDDIALAEWLASEVDWHAALSSYDWRGDWKAGLRDRLELTSALRNAETEETLITAVDAITE